MEQRQNGVGESQFLVDTVLGKLLDARLDVVGGGTGEIVVLHQHAAEVARQEVLPLAAYHVRAVLVPDPRSLLLEVVRKPLVEDVFGHGDVVVGGEHLRARRKPDILLGRVTLPVFRSSVATGRVERGSRP